MADVSPILDEAEPEQSPVADDFLAANYKELRKLAAQELANERRGQTLQPTALVHEVYLRLIAGSKSEPGMPKWNSQAHFFAAAAETMRRILVENARRKKRAKHGGGRERVELGDSSAATPPLPDDIVALDEALTQLTREDPTAAEVVQLHFFAGLSIEQVADALNMSRATAYRQWAYARAWLGCAINGNRT